MASLPIAVRSTLKIAKSALQRRALSDVAITRTGKPIIRVQGGRSSLGGHTATVFGATGALGRYIVNRLARQGCTVIVPFREEMAKRHLKVSGDLGRVVFMEYDLRNTESIEASVRHSDVVYNLVGRNYPTKNFSLEDVHVEGAERIADAVAKYDVDRFIHVSSYNADPESASEFYRTKARGEQVVRSIFPETTIVRPAPMFGFEDDLLLKLASLVNVFTANNMQERYWPVHVIDVGEALEKIFYDDTTASQTYELYGPKNYSTAEIAALVDAEIFKKRRHINLPKAILQPIAGILNRALWWPTMSTDEVEREFIDQVIDESAKTFKDLGMEPGEIKDFTYHYLQGFRSSAYFDLPPSTEKEKREERKYIHVLDDQVLSSGALDALNSFYAERDERAAAFAKLQAEATALAEAEAAAELKRLDGLAKPSLLSMKAFTEDWNESQFWYSDETARLYATQLLEGASAETVIAIVSAPSVFIAMKNILPKVWLLEHDMRFAVFPEFVFYDFTQPLTLPRHIKGTVDCFICDPPFLSEDCQTKFALTARWLSKPSSLTAPSTPAPTPESIAAAIEAIKNGDEAPWPQPKVLICTGERMGPLINKLYRSFGVRTTDYEPAHENGLSNEFYCYANFEPASGIWKWREIEGEV
ncbi:putative N6-adenine methyltransferase-domain-containing protein [Bombardia bombarda]|uniref:Protein-lysine N-methyltransferase EFM5 n=1 Tax=Bombardia bombarda TaxID=252184 RepID=A0AA39W424_9PEZI|nr:putative N6-adenine methyltransferase-domain-containing protein [Bombardia bombarda]